MKFSLIMATYGRDKEVENFLNSLKNQTYKNFELIVVDQNEDDRVYKIVKQFQNDFEIRHFKVNFKGLSRARNYGLKYIAGDVVAFPDDDCEYPNNLLFDVKDFFHNTDYDILTVLAIDRDSGMEVLNRWVKKCSDITPINILRAVSSPCLFIRLSRIKVDDLGFDEKFGVGSVYPSAEEMDLVIRLLRKGARGYFNRNLLVFHPNKDFFNLDRVYNYSIGMGAFFRKHLKHELRLFLPFFENVLIRPIAGIVLNTLKLNKKGILKNCYSLIGRWRGFLIYDSH